MLVYGIFRNGNKKVDKMELKSVVIAGTGSLESGEVFHVEENQEREKNKDNRKEKEKNDEPNDCTV